MPAKGLSRASLAAFDLLASALVLFPLLLGGVWWERPGLKLELAELGVPVLVVALLGGVLARGARLNLAESRVSGAANALWIRWQAALGRRPARAIGIASAVVGALWTLASWRRHWALGSGAADLAIFDGMFWNLTHGLGYHSPMKGGLSLFIDHQSPINLLIAPFYALVPRPETLLAVQGFGLAAGGAAVFALARALGFGPSWIAAACPLLYWSYLPTRNAYFFDFHPETLMLPAFLAALAAFHGRRWLPMAIFLLLGLAGKESGGVVLAGIGLAFVLGGAPSIAASARLRIGAALLAAGVSLFIVQVKVLPHLLFGLPYTYDVAYASYGGGLLAIVTSPILQPAVFWPHLLGKARLRFLFWTLGALGFAPLLAWRTAIAALPCFLMVFLTDGDHRVNLFYYYAIEASIGLFWALPTGLRALEARFRRPRASSWALAGWVLFWALALFDRSDAYRIRKFTPTPHARWLIEEVVPCVGSSEIVAPQALVPHLSARPWARVLPEFGVPAHYGDGPTDSVGCVITDPDVDSWPLPATEAAAWPARLPGLGYRVAYECRGFQLWQRDRAAGIGRPWSSAPGGPPAGAAASGSGGCLACTPPCP